MKFTIEYDATYFYSWWVWVGEQHRGVMVGCAYTKWGAKRLCARYAREIKRREKIGPPQFESYEVNL